MKKSSSKSLTFALALSMATILLALPSCKSLDTTTVDTHHSSLIAHNSNDTVVIRDSVFIREIQKGDTIYLTHVEYRDRWRTRLVHDTILRTDSIVRIVDHPPEKYIPPFYKHCTVILFIILAVGIVYLIIRLRLRL